MTDPTPNPAEPCRLSDEYKFEADFRGETLTYIEPGRKVQIEWTWNNAYRIYLQSIKHWLNADETSSPVSDEDRSAIVERAVKYARDVQHVKLIVEP